MRVVRGAGKALWAALTHPKHGDDGPPEVMDASTEEHANGPTASSTKETENPAPVKSSLRHEGVAPADARLGHVRGAGAAAGRALQAPEGARQNASEQPDGEHGGDHDNERSQHQSHDEDENDDGQWADRFEERWQRHGDGHRMTDAEKEEALADAQKMCASGLPYFGIAVLFFMYALGLVMHSTAAYVGRSLAEHAVMQT